MTVKKSGKLFKKTISLSLALVLAFNTALGAVLVQRYFYKKEINELLVYKEKINEELANTPEKRAERLREEVIPEEGVNTGIKWEDLGKKLVETGVIDKEKFLELFSFSGDRAKYEDLLTNNSSEYIILNEGNSRFVLNTLWALGLVQESKVLTDMQNEFDEVANLASTGGWSLATGDAMEFYGEADLLGLNDEQQELVAEIAKNIYRPCCGNHTAFPDCNHGIALLGLIELMVVNGYSEDDIYATSLKVNSYWFPDTYMTLASYFETKEDTTWEDVNPKLVLGKDFSSGSGYRNIQKQVQPISGSSGGGCGV